MRVFEDHAAKRSQVPLLIGLVGPSSSGKTFSALRLATGIQRVTGGDIFVIDTEARRAEHYADRFTFREVPFGAPFDPLSYLEAIEHCQRKGAKVVVVDSMSHEHEGPGGVLEMHEQELSRLVEEAERRKGREVNPEAYKMSAWQKPKSDRRRMINTILQMPICSIFCFRAKEKLKIERGKDPKPLGYVAIAGDEFLFEMTVNCLLLPGAGGVPAWQSDEVGERAMMKRPEQFKGVFADRAPLSEDVGEAMARWANGDVSLFEQLRGEIDKANPAELELIVPKIENAKNRRAITVAECDELRRAFKAKKAASPARGVLAPERRAAIAEQAGVGPEVVDAVAKFIGGGDSEATIAAALRSSGLAADEAQVANILAELRKG